MSDTGAATAMHERHGEDLGEFVHAFPAQEAQVGAIFVVSGRICGIEMFHAPAIFARLFPKLVRSYGLDAIEENGNGAGAPSAHTSPQALLDAVRRMRVNRQRAIGLGEDLRLHGEDVVGAALVQDGKTVHLAVFARQ